MTVVRIVGPVFAIGLNRSPQEVGALVQYLDQSGYGLLRDNEIRDISHTSAGTLIEIDEKMIRSPQTVSE